ncbi:MAG: glycoside hydrolase family 43 protein [Muribaculaceae bacterium]|nr:glycoside hydrolase family 43 protein [Muribaculaceae bacterium]
MKKNRFLSLVSGLTALCSPLSFGATANLPQEQENDMAAYLLVFFSDSDHSLHFAVSRDGYNFSALNDNKPIISGDSIAEQRGIRDPHIYRGHDGNFYMALTDLHIFAKNEGLRDTEWERPAEYGWGNNRGLVLMKSSDLINWSHNEARLDQLFPDEFGDIGCAWAPQTIYDPEKDAMMVYFTIRKKGENIPGATPDERKTRLYYAYADKDFTTLVTKPEKLYEFPDEKIQVLDADIYPLPNGGYAMTYVSQENPCGIKIAYSDSINKGYNYVDKQIDFEPRDCEAPNVWKRIGEDRWVVMYDVYSINPHNFGFVETTDFRTFIPIGHFNDGPMRTTNFSSPKHGAVIHITKEEADRLENHFPSSNK